jgi:hypothetical protein
VSIFRYDISNTIFFIKDGKMSEQDLPPRDQTKTFILSRNQRAYEELQALIQPLDDEQLSRPASSGWAIKDHLGHLAVWQIGVTALLQGRPRFAAMGAAEAEGKKLDVDEINDMIQRSMTGLSAQQMKEKLRDAHYQMAQQIESMSNEDLFTPYKDFTPGEEGSSDPVLNWIVGDGFDHYDEHIVWIRQILAER